MEKELHSPGRIPRSLPGVAVAVFVLLAGAATPLFADKIVTTLDAIVAAGVSKSIDSRGASSTDRYAIQILTAAALANPGAPTITTHGTGGAATWAYKIVAKTADGTTTAASSAGSTTAGNATIDGSNYNIVTWTPVIGSAGYDIYRTTSGGTPATLGKIGSTTILAVLNDTALVGDTLTAPSSNTTGVYTAKIQRTVNGSTWFDEVPTLLSGEVWYLPAVGPAIFRVNVVTCTGCSVVPSVVISGTAQVVTY